MLLLPQTQEQIRIEAGQATTAVDGYMTAPAQGNVQLRPVGPWTAMVDKQALVRETELAAPIAPQHRFAMSAKALLGVPAPVVTRSAESPREQHRTATRPGTTTPVVSLILFPGPTSLPRCGEHPDRHERQTALERRFDQLPLQPRGAERRVGRPELADVVAAADLTYDWAGVWLRPADGTLSAAWLEGQLIEAALESGLPLTSIRVFAAAGQGSGSTGETDR